MTIENRNLVAKGYCMVHFPHWFCTNRDRCISLYLFVYFYSLVCTVSFYSAKYKWCGNIKYFLGKMLNVVPIICVTNHPWKICAISIVQEGPQRKIYIVTLEVFKWNVPVCNKSLWKLCQPPLEISTKSSSVWLHTTTREIWHLPEA